MPRTPRFNVALAAALAAATVCAPPAARAAGPDRTLFAFPGANVAPSTAVSAGFALADRWLGEQLFDNPATAMDSLVSASPFIQRVSRQDLRAVNSDFDETPGFFGFAGGQIGYSSGEGWGAGAYLSQPEARQEAAAFTQNGSNGPLAPSPIRTTSDSHELRAGVAVSWRWSTFAVGAGPEWTKRTDHFTSDRPGVGPSTGPTLWNLSGSGTGYIVGARLVLPPRVAAGLRVGASVRYVPRLEMSGTAALTPGSTASPTTAERGSAWEAGASASARLGPAFRIIAGATGRTATDWSLPGVTNGRETQYAVAGEYHDLELPWIVRMGVGHESTPGAPEPEATLVGLGLGLKSGVLRYDVGLLHRGLQRAGSPKSSDDRVLATITLVLASQ